MLKFLFRLVILAVGAFVMIYFLQDPRGKRQMQNFVQNSLTVIEQNLSQRSQPGPSTTCNCRVYRYGKWQYVTKTCPPGMSCAQCCN